MSVIKTIRSISVRINRLDYPANFTALQINPKLAPEIAERGENYISQMQKYGESLSNITRYNVVFDENLNMPKIKSSDKDDKTDYFAQLRKEEQYLGRRYEHQCGMEGDTVSGFYPDEPSAFTRLYGKEDAKGMYSMFKELPLYEKAAEYSKILDELAARRAKAVYDKTVAELEAIEQRSKLHDAAINLTEKYKYTVFVASEQKDNSQKQGIWGWLVDLFS